MTRNLDELKAAYDAAREADRLHRTPATMDAVKVAWTALDAAAPRRKVSGYASRAGKRQATERKAATTGPLFVLVTPSGNYVTRGTDRQGTRMAFTPDRKDAREMTAALCDFYMRQCPEGTHREEVQS